MADEAAEVRWFPLDEAQAMIGSEEILGAMTVIGIQHALLRRAVGLRTSAMKSGSA